MGFCPALSLKWDVMDWVFIFLWQSRPLPCPIFKNVLGWIGFLDSFDKICFCPVYFQNGEETGSCGVCDPKTLRPWLKTNVLCINFQWLNLDWTCILLAHKSVGSKIRSLMFLYKGPWKIGVYLRTYIDFNNDFLLKIA